MNDLDFLILSIGTVFIAAAGYIINDIIDLPIDLINKPQKVIIQKQLSTSTAWKTYSTLNLIALGIGIYLTSSILLGIFVVTILGLALYALYWKRQVLIGNIVVALLCALVVVEVWILDIENLSNNIPLSSNIALQLLIGYTLFAFFTTIIRELIKDIEDIEGDRLQNCRTAPIVWGIPKSKILLIVLGITLLIGLSIALYAWQSFLALTLLILFNILIILPLLAILTLLSLAKSTIQYAKLSKFVKIYMGLGLVWLALLLLN
ncbi:MAG: UbiA family prenyltransferase [Aureispira sp.]|nr:UbiA family prenyltransferase [Aureispira sp.]